MGVHEVAECDQCGVVVDIESGRARGWMIVKGFDAPSGHGLVTMQGYEADKLVCSKACAHAAVEARAE